MSRLLRRVVAVPAVAFALASSAFAVTAAPASADDAGTLTVVGTSDVFDSNLVQTVLKPGFENYEASQGRTVTLNYISKGTGAAIAYAETGAASAMIVHAASLENQFVGSGYSLETYGRAIFWGDYVLLGPASDPAGVLTGAKHDIVSAFEKVAAAGVQGKATFVSRGGTPGTTVQEHALWALSSGVPTCDVTAVNGGGEAPSTTTGTCPTNPTNPGWYQTTGLTQGPNVIAADTCNFGSAKKNCYVFTDRGTYQYLRSTGQAQSLQIVTRTNNAPGAAGGIEALVNSFHAYSVNPAAFSDPNVQAGINTTEARNFLSWITSPAAQTAIGQYLANGAAGAPFLPDAAPNISQSAYPNGVTGGGTLTVSGVVANVVPGARPLNGEQVRLVFTPATGDRTPQQVATATTGAGGNYTLTYRPTATGTYRVTTPVISRIEDPDLNPAFGDLLAPGTTKESKTVTVKGVATFTVLTGGKGRITGKVSLSPVDTAQAGSLLLYAGRGSDPLTQQPNPVVIPVGASSVQFSYPLPAGAWNVAVHYVNNGVITEGVSKTKPVTVS